MKNWLAPILIFLAAPSFVFAQAQQQQQGQPQGGSGQPPGQNPPAKPKPKPKPKPKTEEQKPTAAEPEKAQVVQKIKGWTIFKHDGADGLVCFVAAPPADMQPKAAKRTPVIFYVTDWQKDGIRNEISVRQGYSLKPNSIATVTIGNQNFAMATEEDKAFVKSPDDERKLMAAMALGGSMFVKGISAKGTATTDEYKLDGITDAVKKLHETCQ